MTQILPRSREGVTPESWIAPQPQNARGTSNVTSFDKLVGSTVAPRMSWVQPARTAREALVYNMAAACNPFTSNLFSVDGRVAVVTGGSRGIGLMIAEGFVRGGATVYITSRKQAVCSQEATRLTLLGPGTCIGVAADIATEDGRRTVTEFVRAREKHVHVLVNNAGCNWVCAHVLMHPHGLLLQLALSYTLTPLQCMCVCVCVLSGRIHGHVS